MEKSKKKIANRRNMDKIKDLNYKQYLKRLVEIHKNIETTQGDVKNGWLSYLGGYLEALKVLETD